jgi:UDP-N-acetylmuramate dehydrogenase
MNIEKNVLLKNKVWFETGGPAEYFCEPQSIKDVKEAITFAKDNNLKITILGLGANVLISDDGVKGLVISPHIGDISYTYGTNDTVLLTAGSGINMEHLIAYCLNNNIIGLEEFSGIPSTIGGAVYINLHYFQFLISQFFIKGTVIDLRTGSVEQHDKEWFEFGYDHSKLCTKYYCLIDATFQLRSCSDIETAYAKGRSNEITRHRKQRYPYKGTCGSFFRNFFPDEVSIESNGKKMIYAAYYLDKTGVKGALKVGGAGVSHQHANMIVNMNNAMSSDIIAVARSMQEKVQLHFDIILQPECELIGFEEYPLLK